MIDEHGNSITCSDWLLLMCCFFQTCMCVCVPVYACLCVCVCVNIFKCFKHLQTMRSMVDSSDMSSNCESCATFSEILSHQRKLFTDSCLCGTVYVFGNLGLERDLLGGFGLVAWPLAVVQWATFSRAQF